MHEQKANSEIQIELLKIFDDKDFYLEMKFNLTEQLLTKYLFCCICQEWKNIFIVCLNWNKFGFFLKTFSALQKA